jgi:tripartite-type tricarboxylate transporter receptor subunit TctC
VPTLAESGFPGFDISTWYGIFAPAGTPKPVLDRLNAAVTAVMARPDMKEMWNKLGAEFAPESAEAFGKFWLSELDRWGAAARAAKLEPQ